MATDISTKEPETFRAGVYAVQGYVEKGSDRLNCLSLSV